MAITNPIVDTLAVNIGQSYQRNTSALVDCYAHGVLGNYNETSSAVTFTWNMAFWYDGYQNLIPIKAGFYVLDQNNTLKSTHTISDGWETTSSSEWWSGSDWNWHWVAGSDQTSSVAKPSSGSYGILPYVQFGCINRWESDFANGNDWMFNTTYGLLAVNSIQNSYLADSSFTYNGVTNTIKGWTFLVGTNTSEFSYSNCPIKTGTGGIYVYNSSGVPKKATAVYVYNSSGVPKKVSQIAVYNSSGVPKTITV